MNCWKAARKIAGLLETKREAEIIEILELFSLEQRQFIISVKYYNSSLLFIAVTNELVFLVTYFLVSCEADPNSYGWIEGYKVTCLAAAVIQNSKILVKILLAVGANAESVCSPSEITALHLACRKSHLELAQILIEHGANINSQEIDGQTCLMECTNNFELFEYLISVGADVNLVNELKETSLLQAFEARENKIILLLLGYEKTNVRLKTLFGEDALHFAVKFSSENVINRVIRKGSYTKDEIIKVYEMQSCLSHVMGLRVISNKLWKKALILSGKPRKTPKFKNPHPTGKLNEVRYFFTFDDAKALLYLESTCGLNNLFMLHTYRKATKNVNDAERCIILCKFFFEIVYSLDDMSFFLAIPGAELVIWHLFRLNNQLKSNASKGLDILVEYIEDIHIRLKRLTPKERVRYGFLVESFLGDVFEIFDLLNKNFSQNTYLFYERIKRIIKLDPRGLSQKSLLQLCGNKFQDLIEPIFLEHRANVNSTDKLGKTVLHTLIESNYTSQKVVKDIIECGFDFHPVKYDEYCLRCRMEREGILLNPVKHGSLQCLATKAFCEKAMTCFNDLPYHLTAIVNSHLYLK